MLFSVCNQRFHFPPFYCQMVINTDICYVIPLTPYSVYSKTVIQVTQKASGVLMPVNDYKECFPQLWVDVKVCTPRVRWFESDGLIALVFFSPILGYADVLGREWLMLSSSYPATYRHVVWCLMRALLFICHFALLFNSRMTVTCTL